MNKGVKWGLLLSLVAIFVASAVTVYAQGVKKKRRLPHQYGNVFMDNHSTRNKVSPVIFNHWLHRAKYTCRLCHVDLGFAMEANATGVREGDNKAGFYCGACHNGKEAFGPTGKDLLGHEKKNCDRCHSYGTDVAFEEDFYKFTKGLPRGRFGNGIDWERAEEEGKITLKDYLEGVSIKRKPLGTPEDVEVKSHVTNIPDIIFSHKKHAVWNGCELCHPDIFGVRKGVTTYTMTDIFAGKYCGVCHDKVAFPNIDCQRCHTKPVY